jgi:uncharacterized membrane protein YgcG
MRFLASTLIALILCGSAFAADHLSKLNKELKKIDDVASVRDGRRIVNQAMADQFGVKRLQLVAERRESGFNYGQLFIAHEFASEAKLKFEDVAAEMKAGKTLGAIAEIHDVDLKDLVKEAKSFNSEIAKALDEAAGDDSDSAPDAPDVSGDDSYDPSSDSEPSDTEGMSPKDLARNNATVHSQGAQHAAANAQGVGLGRGSSGSNPGFGSSGGGGGRPGSAGASGSHRPPL